MPSFASLSKVGGEAMKFAGAMVGKPPAAGGDAEAGASSGGSWASSAGELVGGIMGTGAGASGSMTSMAGQMIGGAMGT